jgi:hypothetical protein
MANNPRQLKSGILGKQTKYDQKNKAAYNKYIAMGYDPATAQMKTNVEVNYDNDFNKNYDDYSDKTFDNYGLITEKGRSQLKDFLANKNLTTEQIMKLNNADFNNLAKEVQQKYGIDDFDLAQEFLVSEL